MLGKSCPSRVALQRGKAKNVTPVALQNELHQAVAKTADSVKKENRVGGHSSILVPGSTALPEGKSGGLARRTARQNAGATRHKR